MLMTYWKWASKKQSFKLKMAVERGRKKFIFSLFYHSKADVWEVCPYRLHSMRLPKFQYLGNKSNKNHKTCVIWNPRVYKPGVKIQTRCTKAQLFESIYCHRPNHQPPESHATPLDRHWDIPQPKYQLRRPLSNSRLLKYIFSQILYQRDDKYKYFTLRTKCCLIHRNCRAFDKWFSI